VNCNGAHKSAGTSQRLQSRPRSETDIENFVQVTPFHAGIRTLLCFRTFHLYRVMRTPGHGVTNKRNRILRLRIVQLQAFGGGRDKILLSCISWMLTVCRVGDRRPGGRSLKRCATQEESPWCPAPARRTRTTGVRCRMYSGS